MFSCNKDKKVIYSPPIRDKMPYGKVSVWSPFGGDTTLKSDLTLTHYYTEKKDSCNLYYYELSYPIWSEYDYNHCVNECGYNKDTLVIKDFNSNKKAIFIRNWNHERLISDIASNAKLTKADGG